MANWCNNYVSFQGDEIKIRKVVDEFRLITAMSYAEGQQIIKDDGSSGYIFDIYAGGEEDEQDWVNFQTKWAPVPNQIRKIAEAYGLKFEYEYEELGNGVYGKYFFDGDTVLDICLTNAEIDLVQPCNEDEEFWIYNGEEYEVREDALEIVLQDKINKNEKHSTILIG